MLSLLLWGALAPAALAGVTEADLRAVTDCLDVQDVACAQQGLARLGASTSDDVNVLALSALVAFSAGDYPTASDTMKRAVAKGFPDRYDPNELLAQNGMTVENMAAEAVRLLNE